MDAQLKKGILEMCVLNQVRNHEMYGYEIMKLINSEFPDVYEGSVYSILRRLHSEGCTETIMRESESGPPRKYYRITNHGLEQLSNSINEWNSIVSSVKKLGIGPN
jgi:PadR family transcriptional regulator PadR